MKNTERYVQVYDNVKFPLAFEQRFKVIDSRITHVEDMINYGILDNTGRYLDIQQDTDGKIVITLQNDEHVELSHVDITTTKKILKSAQLSLDEQKIIFTALDDTTFDCDISALLTLINNKLDASNYMSYQDTLDYLNN